MGATLFLHSEDRGQHARKHREETGAHTIAHVGRAATVHVRGLEIRGGKAKVGKLDDNFTFLSSVRQSGPAVGHDKVLGLDIAMEDVLGMAGSDSVAHLGEHGRNEPEAGPRQ